jgi:hypothetical protein
MVYNDMFIYTIILSLHQLHYNIVSLLMYSHFLIIRTYNTNEIIDSVDLNYKLF